MPGHARTIHFPFDIKLDTPAAVAKEMVQELDLTDQDVTAISEMIESEIQSCFPDWSATDHKVNSHGSLSLEQLPSGRKYWNAAPKNDGLTLEPIREDQGSSHGDPSEGMEEILRHDDVDIIMEKLENIMMEQKKELDELKKQHGLRVHDILMELPPETRKEVVNAYKVEILKACILDMNCTDVDCSFDS